jgi:hypothetical protein
VNGIDDETQCHRQSSPAHVHAVSERRDDGIGDHCAQDGSHATAEPISISSAGPVLAGRLALTTHATLVIPPRHAPHV